jgi:hypothetical protein
LKRSNWEKQRQHRGDDKVRTDTTSR